METSPVLLDSFEGKGINSIYCGEDFTLATTESGSIYSWGSGNHGHVCILFFDFYQFLYSLYI